MEMEMDDMPECCRESYRQGEIDAFTSVEEAANHGFGCICYPCWLVKGLLNEVVKAKTQWFDLTPSKHDSRCFCYRCWIFSGVLNEAVRQVLCHQAFQKLSHVLRPLRRISSTTWDITFTVTVIREHYGYLRNIGPGPAHWWSCAGAG